MLDHVAFGAGDFQRSRDFYVQLLEPLGIGVVIEDPGRIVGFGSEDGPFFAIRSDRTPLDALHVAFTAPGRGAVDAFHAAGLKAGGTDNGGPGLRDYRPNYYAAFVLDPDGNNIEAVCHEPD
jgi:catechol 2,3-dioxygenase-like lactoylglutathione lyase family enzyme